MTVSNMQSPGEISGQLAQQRDGSISPALFGTARHRCGLDTGVNLLAAPPSMGVTALALQIANVAAAQNLGTQVAVFPVKDGAGSAAERLISQRRPPERPNDHHQRIQIDLGVALHTKELIRGVKRWGPSIPVIVTWS